MWSNPPFFCTILKKGGIYMSISSYIRNHQKLSLLDFATVYEVIIALIQDEKMDWPVESI